MVEIVKQYGVERMIVNSACDWGVSDPLSVSKTVHLLQRAGILDDDIDTHGPDHEEGEPDCCGDQDEKDVACGIIAAPSSERVERNGPTLVHQ